MEVLKLNWIKKGIRLRLVFRRKDDDKINKKITIDDNEVNELFTNIKDLIEQSRNRIYKTVNTEMINLYWNIGKMIIEKQKGKSRAKYGDFLIEGISKKLTENFGKGFQFRI